MATTSLDSGGRAVGNLHAEDGPLVGGFQGDRSTVRLGDPPAEGQAVALAALLGLAPVTVLETIKIFRRRSHAPER